jgi:hypothetical protein
LNSKTDFYIYNIALQNYHYLNRIGERKFIRVQKESRKGKFSSLTFFDILGLKIKHLFWKFQESNFITYKHQKLWKIIIFHFQKMT